LVDPVIRRQSIISGVTHGFEAGFDVRSVCGAVKPHDGGMVATRNVINCSVCVRIIRAQRERDTVVGTGQVFTPRISEDEFQTHIDFDGCGADRRRICRDHPDGGRYAIFVPKADVPAAIERVARYDPALLQYSDLPTVDETTEPCTCGAPQEAQV
jgi:hypothetical protein